MTYPAQTTALETGTSIGEGGLGSYLGFAQTGVKSCEDGIANTEGTLNDMAAHNWSGPRVDAGYRAMEMLAAARDAYADWVAALEGSLNVADSYSANEGTGDQQTVTNV